MLVYQRFLTEGIAQLSYLVGDDGARTAAVIDPRPDAQIYIDAAREQGLAITHIFETHIHADFMSGSRELAARLGGVPIYVSGEGDPAYAFDVQRIRDGQTFTFGSTLLRVRFTPGHTPEHVAYEICRASEPDRPWGVFTGDSLFVDSAGRPDLLGEAETEGLVEHLYHTLQDYFLKLDDEVLIFPGHGKGSPCGPAIGERLSTSIGFERRSNRFLQMSSLDQFKDAMLGDQPAAPTHFPRMKKLNAQGPAIVHGGPYLRPLEPGAFQQWMDGGEVQLVDARHMLAFGGGHIPGAINLGANKAEMSVFAGWMLDPQTPILLVVDDSNDPQRVAHLLLRTGFTNTQAYLAGGMTAWNNEGRPLQRIPQLSAEEVHDRQEELQVLDVRQDAEWEAGHLPGATHFPFNRLREQTPPLDKGQPVVTYCATGYRASMSASLLQREGFAAVNNFPGSWKAWKSRDLPVSNNGGGKG